MMTFWSLVLVSSLDPVVPSEVLHDQGAFIWLRYLTTAKKPNKQTTHREA